MKAAVSKHLPPPIPVKAPAAVTRTSTASLGATGVSRLDLPKVSQRSWFEKLVMDSRRGLFVNASMQSRPVEFYTNQITENAKRPDAMRLVAMAVSQTELAAVLVQQNGGDYSEADLHIGRALLPLLVYAEKGDGMTDPFSQIYLAWARLLNAEIKHRVSPNLKFAEKQVRKAIKTLVKTDPEVQQLYGVLIGDAYFTLGEVLSKQGRQSEAAEAYRETLRSFNRLEDPQVQLHMRALCQYRLGRFHHADPFRKPPTATVQRVKPYFLRAYSFLKLSGVEEPRLHPVEPLIQQVMMEELDGEVGETFMSSLIEALADPQADAGFWRGFTDLRQQGDYFLEHAATETAEGRDHLRLAGKYYRGARHLLQKILELIPDPKWAVMIHRLKADFRVREATILERYGMIQCEGEELVRLHQYALGLVEEGLRDYARGHLSPAQIQVWAQDIDLFPFNPKPLLERLEQRDGAPDLAVTNPFIKQARKLQAQLLNALSK